MVQTHSTATADFFAQFTPFTCDTKEILIRNGDTPKGVYYLTEGLIKVVGFSKRGDELTLNIFKPQSYFPLTWAIAEFPNRYTFQALTGCRGFRAPSSEVKQFLKSQPDSLYELCQRLLKGLAGIQERTEFLMKDHADTKLISACFLLAKRFGVTSQTGIEVTIPITHQELASLAGISRETVTRKLHQLQKKGLITRSNRNLVIPDLEALMEVDLPV